MLEVEPAWRVVLYFEPRRQQMPKTKLESRGTFVKVVTVEVDRDLTLGVEDWRRVSVRTTPARCVEGSIVGPIVP